MQKFRVAIAGVGRAAKEIHIPALKKLPNAEIVGVYDPLQKASEFPSFATLEQLLGTRPDVVVVATPPDSHPSRACRARLRVAGRSTSAWCGSSPAATALRRSPSIGSPRESTVTWTCA